MSAANTRGIRERRRRRRFEQDLRDPRDQSLADAWILTDPPPRIVRTEIDPLAAHRAWVNAGLNSVNAGLNSKIMTIKAVREATGAGLREAKTAVETVEGGDLIAAIAYVNEKGWARPGWTQP